MNSKNQWQINGHVFDADKRTLLVDQETVVLEPKAAALLAYFCQNPNKHVSRDELIEQVWQGHIVSDNAINRVVVVLRKALKDDDKVKHVIATVPKVGYQMIANLSAYEEKDTNSASDERSMIKVALVMAVLLSAVLVLAWAWPEDNTQELLVESKPNNQVPLLRKSGNQSDGEISVLGHLAYSNWQNKQSSIEVLFQGESIAVNVSANIQVVRFPVWSKGGSFLLFVGMDDQGCQIFKAEVTINDKKQVMQPPESIYACDGKNIISLTIDVNNQWLYLAGREAMFAPNQVWAVEISKSGDMAKDLSVNQPVAKGLGLHHIDAHPIDSGKLLAISDEVPGHSYFYQIDINNGNYELLKQLPYHVASGVWSHDGQHVVHPSVHPAYGVVKSEFGAADPALLLTDSRRVSFPKRHPNGSDYLYTSYLTNRDIMMAGESLPVNSSVMDYLPTASNDSQQLAFVSKRSGFSEIWIFGFEDNSLFNISPPDRGRTFYDIQWSWDDRYILANTDSGLLLFDVQLGQSTKEWKTKELVYAINWLSESRFNYSVYENGQWQTWQQAINETDRQMYSSENGMILSDGSQKYVFDESLKLVSHELNTSACQSVMYRRKSTWQVEAGQLYCVDAESNEVLALTAELAEALQSVTPFKVAVSESFNWAEERMIYSEVTDSSSDLMMISIE